MAEPAHPYTIEADGLRLTVRLTPRASRNGLDGVNIGADGRPVLCIRLAAPPVEGAANAALLAFLAETLDLRRAGIRFLSGETSRLKRLHLAGDGAALAARLEALLAKA